MRMFPFQVIPTELGSERPIWQTWSNKWCHGLLFTVPSKVFFFNSCVLWSNWCKSIHAVVFFVQNIFILYLYIRCIPTFQMGYDFPGFSYHEFVNPQVLKYTTHQGAVRLAKLLFFKPLVSDKRLWQVQFPIFHLFLQVSGHLTC